MKGGGGASPEREPRSGSIRRSRARALGATAGALFAAALEAALFPARFAVFLARRRSHLEAFSRAASSSPPPSPPPTEAPATPRPGPPKTIWISVGDVSAEAHAVRLMREANRRRADLRWIGFGGERMRGAGCEVREDLVALGLIGFGEPIRALPRLLRIVHGFALSLVRDRPDLVLLLDYPGLNLPLARLARRRGIPVLYYLAPQTWAWAPWRARSMRRRLSGVLCALPFEEPYFRSLGLDARFVGHPLADALAEEDARSADPAGDSPPKGAILVLLPGSRLPEIRAHLPVLVRAARALFDEEPRPRPVVATTRPESVPLLRDLAGEDVEIALGPLGEALGRARLALAKSGTAILEVAARGVPLAVLYRVSRCGKRLASRLLALPHFASINLLARREVVPEILVAEGADERRLVESARALWRDGERREGCRAELLRLRPLFAKPGTAARAAEALLETLGRPSAPPRRRRAISRIATVALAALASLGLGEAAVRALDPFGISYFRETIRYRNECLRLVAGPDGNPDLDGVLFEHLPGARVPLRRFEVSINAEGLRGPEVPIPKPAGTYRILVLGDSVVFGWGVEERDTFVRRLEAALRERAAHRGDERRFEVVNAGHLLFDTTQEAALFAAKGDRLDPDAVLLVYVVNDVEPSRDLFEAAIAAPPPSRPTRGLLLTARALPALAGLWQFVRESTRAPLSPPPPGWPDRDPATRPGWERSARALLRLRDGCASRKAPFVVLDHTLPAIEALPRFCAAEGIRLAPFRFEAHERRPQFRNSPADAHANAAGHALLLEKALAILEREGLPPRLWDS